MRQRSIGNSHCGMDHMFLKCSVANLHNNPSSTSHKFWVAKLCPCCFGGVTSESQSWHREAAHILSKKQRFSCDMFVCLHEDKFSRHGNGNFGIQLRRCLCFIVKPAAPLSWTVKTASSLNMMTAASQTAIGCKLHAVGRTTMLCFEHFFNYCISNGGKTSINPHWVFFFLLLQKTPGIKSEYNLEGAPPYFFLCVMTVDIVVFTAPPLAWQTAEHFHDNHFEKATGQHLCFGVIQTAL